MSRSISQMKHAEFRLDFPAFLSPCKTHLILRQLQSSWYVQQHHPDLHNHCQNLKGCVQGMHLCVMFYTQQDHTFAKNILISMATTIALCLLPALKIQNFDQVQPF